MKYSILIIALIIGFMTAGSQDLAAQKPMDEFSVMVDGLGCPFCAYGLEKKFREFKGIKGIRIDMETGFVTFNFPAEKQLGLKEVIAQVEESGYTPMESKVERADGTSEFEGVPEVIIPEDVVVSDASFTVSGKCAMCRARIEKATKVLPGVFEASWDQESQKLALKYDKKQISSDEVQMAIARIGHDTELQRAPDKVYKKLHGCCKYDRVL